MIRLQCTKCKQLKNPEDFHRSKNRKSGRHSWCAICSTSAQKISRVRNHSPENKKKWLLKNRYGLTPEQVQNMMENQNGLCAICQTPPKRPCIDHCHTTGKVRGILCHYCNIRLPTVENKQYVESALIYLKKEGKV